MNKRKSLLPSQTPEVLQAMELKGYLSKKGGNDVFKRYQKRFFQVQQEGTLLAYYDTEADFKKGKEPKGGIILLDVDFIESGSGTNDLKLVYPGRDYELRADNAKEKDKWVIGLTDLLKYLKKNEKALRQKHTFNIKKNEIGFVNIITGAGGMFLDAGGLIFDAGKAVTNKIGDAGEAMIKGIGDVISHNKSEEKTGEVTNQENSEVVQEHIEDPLECDGSCMPLRYALTHQSAAADNGIVSSKGQDIAVFELETRATNGKLTNAKQYQANSESTALENDISQRDSDFKGRPESDQPQRGFFRRCFCCCVARERGSEQPKGNKE